MLREQKKVFYHETRPPSDANLSSAPLFTLNDKIQSTVGSMIKADVHKVCVLVSMYPHLWSSASSGPSGASLPPFPLQTGVLFF